MQNAVPVLDVLDELEGKLDLGAALDGAVRLVQRVVSALDDGKLSLLEILSIGRELVRIVRAAKKSA